MSYHGRVDDESSEVEKPLKYDKGWPVERTYGMNQGCNRFRFAETNEDASPFGNRNTQLASYNSPPKTMAQDIHHYLKAFAESSRKVPKRSEGASDELAISELCEGVRWTKQSHHFEFLGEAGNLAPRQQYNQIDYKDLIMQCQRLQPYALAAQGKSDLLCISCNERPVSRAFMPCEHASLCDACIERKGVGPFQFSSKVRNAEVINTSDFFAQLDLSEMEPPRSPRGSNGFNKLYDIVTTALHEALRSFKKDGSTFQHHNRSIGNSKADIGWNFKGKNRPQYGPDALEIRWDICPVCHSRIFATVKCGSSQRPDVQEAIKNVVAEFHSSRDELLKESLDDITCDYLNCLRHIPQSTLDAATKIDGPDNPQWRLKFARTARRIREKMDNGYFTNSDRRDIRMNVDCPVHQPRSLMNARSSNNNKSQVERDSSEEEVSSSDQECTCHRTGGLLDVDEDENVPILIQTIISTIDAPFVSGFLNGIKDSFDIKKMLDFLSNSDE